MLAHVGTPAKVLVEVFLERVLEVVALVAVRTLELPIEGPMQIVVVVVVVREGPRREGGG